MMSNEYYLIVFDSINYANYLQSELIKYRYEVEKIKTPKFLTNDYDDYNIALKIYEEALEPALGEIRDDKLKVYKIYKHYYNNGRRTYRLLKSNNEKYDKVPVDNELKETSEEKEENCINDTKAEGITIEEFIESIEIKANKKCNEDIVENEDEGSIEVESYIEKIEIEVNTANIENI